MQVYDSLSELVGNTPLLRLRSVTRGVPGSQVLAKVEYFNPGGSVKDRIALRMIAAAEASGQLRPGGTIVEPTSGNTGAGLAIVAAERGYRCVFVCPDKVAQDKISVLRAYGAEVVVCPGTVAPDHPDSYYSVARRLAAETPGGWQPDQYANPENPASHYATTGPEIWAQTDGTVTHFVAGIGTGGTITGTGRYLKEISGGTVKVIGADPEGSVYSGGSGRPYLVEGVGEDIWPATYDPEVCDEIIAVSDAQSFGMTRRLAREEALLVGGSSGLAVAAALRVAERAGPGAVVVVLLSVTAVLAARRGRRGDPARPPVHPLVRLGDTGPPGPGACRPHRAHLRERQPGRTARVPDRLPSLHGRRTARTTQGGRLEGSRYRP